MTPTPKMIKAGAQAILGDMVSLDDLSSEGRDAVLSETKECIEAALQAMCQPIETAPKGKCLIIDPSGNAIVATGSFKVGGKQPKGWFWAPLPTPNGDT